MGCLHAFTAQRSLEPILGERESAQQINNMFKIIPQVYDK